MRTHFFAMNGRSLWAMALVLCVVMPSWADTAKGPQVEIKKHSTGKEATVRLGEREWFIHIDVDQDRTMILRSESDKGQEKNSQSEIVERPMSNTEVDHLVNDFVSGIKSTIP